MEAVIHKSRCWVCCVDARVEVLLALEKSMPWQLSLLSQGKPRVPER
jgi:hypothetical protein